VKIVTLKKKRFRLNLVKEAIVIPITVLWLIPIWLILAISVRSSANTFNVGLGIARPTFQNYVDVWNQNNLIMHFINSFIITGVSVLLVMFLASTCAYAISIIKFKGRNLLFIFMLLIMLLPVPGVVVPLIRVLKSLNLINNYLGLIGPYIALGIPFSAVIMKRTLDNFSKEILEAARLDGCSNWQAFFKIIIPLNKPTLAVIAIWQFMTSWNEFILAMLVMTEVKLKPLILVPVIYNGVYLINPSHLFAILGICTIPIIIFYLALQKYFVSGLTAGAVKG
jgi:raffinose/stachyose/melibiose transport system permease protein